MQTHEANFIGKKRAKTPSSKQKNEDNAQKEFEAKKKQFLDKAKKHPLSLKLGPCKVHPEISALTFDVKAKFNKARASVLTLPHGEVQTPVYMPVGTKGAMKGLLSCDLDRMGCKLMLNNTYHLAMDPGDDFLKKHFGFKDQRSAHHYMNWSHNVLTDSGGFQIVSLSKLSARSEEGVEFISHLNPNKKIFLSPEQSMKIQNNLGSDIMMALDDVIPPVCNINEIYDACERSLRWIDRCIEAHANKQSQNLFGIVQGGIDLKLRKIACDEMSKRQLPGYAIGGMAGGESKADFWKVVDTCTDNLPLNKPRYLMGIGYPVDLVICGLLGVDMFDCVFATRTARFGTAFTNFGFLKLKSDKNRYDFLPIDPECQCEVCKSYTRSYFHFTLNRNARALSLVSFHNVYYLLHLMKRLRQSIIDNKVNDFCKDFFSKQFQKQFPSWVYFALKKAGVNVDFIEELGYRDFEYEEDY